MVTAEEREAQEIEERRRRRAELLAKLAAEKAAPNDTGEVAAAAPVSTSAAESEGQAASAAAIAANGRAASEAAGADASAAVTAVTAADPGGREGGGGVRDEEGGVVVESDDDAHEMEALFQSAASEAARSNAGTGDASAGEDGDDIFASGEDDDEVAALPGNIDAVAEAEAKDDRRDVRQAAQFRKPTEGLSDMYDDSQGYYTYRIGELIGGRYEVLKASGKGVFSTVVTARDKMRQDAAGNNPLVAIKMIRANDVMTSAGKTEAEILNRLATTDPDGRKHIIHLLRSFDYRHHLCLVFEHMEMNLRELTRRVGVGRGLKIDAVGQIAFQMLIALKHLRSANVLHADVKPDNILINHRMNKIKLCDLGSAAFYTGHNDLTPYLVSRFYRAPEVMLGLPYDFAMDMWSIACTIYELYTADILFKGRNNNEMLKLIMALKGPFPKKMIRKAQFASQHFADDANLSFVSAETDIVTNEPVKKLVASPAKKHTMLQLLTKVAVKEYRGNVPREEMRKVEQLADFLERATALDPGTRLTPTDGMQTKFIMAAKQQIAAQQQQKRKR